MRKEIVDISAGGILLLFSVAGFLMANQLGNGQPYGPDFFPKLILALLAIASVFLVTGAAFRMRQEAGPSPTQFDRAAIGKILALIVVLIAYILLFSVTGFIISTILFLLVAQWIFGIRKILLLGTVSIVVPVVLYIVFTMAFKIPLP
ncbi:tripartite tricarboxylate transporter TctB family protein [Sporosarcina cyprini]|uniref:tripartite tricarboxylate transporter TctB family protein n=1 Tax=Sporosarcina cyprini TaxID=2910523 RepID=UPI001EDD97D5|nr:tripartite tricarboxylate transporter TctB family protein [Sporosarcina cyprini]MCG3088263.1 tripartite tricarboxylate transporter TctB family protein [Sporosarcina cyprini]